MTVERKDPRPFLTQLLGENAVAKITQTASKARELALAFNDDVLQPTANNVDGTAERVVAYVNEVAARVAASAERVLATEELLRKRAEGDVAAPPPADSQAAAEQAAAVAQRKPRAKKNAK